MANVAPNGVNQFLDENGNPLAGGLVYTYNEGTSTPKLTWQDQAETTPHANPIVLNSAGRASIFWRGNYRVEVRTAANVLVTTIDGFRTPDQSGAISQVFQDGSASTPSIRFSQALTSGLYSPAVNQVGMAVNGALATLWDSAGNVGIGGTPTRRLDVFGTGRFQGTLTVTTGGITVAAGGVTVTAGGLTVAAGGAAITGNSSVAGNLAVSAGTFASRGFTDNATAAAWNIDASGRLLNNGDTQIGFCARRITSNITAAGVVVFNDTAFAGGHNLGGAYSTSTGLFTVPAGLTSRRYLFTATVPVDNTSGGDANPGVALQVNGADIVKPAYAIRTGVGTLYVFNAILRLNAGDTVGVRYDAAITSAVLVGATFSGILLG